MNRFLSSRTDEDPIFQGNVKLINTIEKDGILVKDDIIVEKIGKNIEAAKWIFDHSIEKTVWGIQMTTSVLSGRYGMYPISAGLHFSVVTGDFWYYTKDLIKLWKEKKLDWVFHSKGNRRTKIRVRWTTHEEIDLSYTDSRIFTISGNTYSVWEIDGRVKDIGSVKAIISVGISGRRYYVTNHRNWKAKRILEIYMEHLGIEVIHRDFKQERG